MTIEVDFVPAGKEGRMVLGQIEPGGFGSFPDYSAAVPKVIAVYCYRDNSQCDVYTLDNEGFPKDPSSRVDPIKVFTADKLTASILHGERYEKDIITETRRKGRLILRHTLTS